MTPRIAPALRASRIDLATAGQGFVAENFTRAAANTAGPLTSQAIYAAAIGLRNGDVITNCHCTLTVAGAGTAPTLIKMALLDKAGKVLQQSANENANAKWTSTGLKTVAMAATYTVPADDLYFAAILLNGAFGTTAMQLLRNASNAVASDALATFVSSMMVQLTQTDFAATGSSQTLVGSGTSNFWWMAVS